MTFKEDITIRIKQDFGNNSNKALTLLKDAIKQADYLKTDRVIRCIIFLAKGSIAELNKNIQMAILDTRDVMLWAEYEKPDGELDYKRIRDFNKPFDECSIDAEQ